MTNFLPNPLLAGLIAASAPFTPLDAQSAKSPPTSAATSETSTDEAQERPPAFATGIGVGALRYAGGRTAGGASATLQYSPRSWLTFSATPGIGRTTLGSTSNSGLTDMPVSAGASHALGDLPPSPSISGSLYTSLSFGDTTNALGVGRSTLGASAAVSARATDRLNVTVGGSHPLSANAGNGSLDLESAYSLGKATVNLGFTGEVGQADSGATLARSIAGGVAFAVAGPLTLTLDGSHGLTTSSPLWSVSMGFGTAFAGISPLNSSSPLRRLTKAFGSRVSSTSGYSSTKGGSRSCKKAGTC